MKTRRIPIGALLAAMLIAACASTSNREIEGQIARHALTVGQTVSQLQQAVIALNKSGAVPNASALKAQEGFKLIADQGVKLAAVLRVIDEKRGAAGDLASAKALIESITDTLLSVASNLTGSGMTDQVRALIRAVVATTSTILVELGRQQ